MRPVNCDADENCSAGAREPSSTNAAGSSQSIPCDPVLALADGLFHAGEYSAAVTEYKRFLFFNRESSLGVYAMIQIGKAFRSAGELDDAQHWLLKAARAAGNTALGDACFAQSGEVSQVKTVENREAVEKSAGPEVLRVNALLEHALISLVKGEYTKAEFELYQLSSMDALSPALVRRIRFHQGLLFVYTARWREAEGAFSEALADHPETLTAVRDVLKEAAGRNLKNPTAAKVLSTVLPGLGQTYSGKPLQGVNALVVNGGVFFLFGWNIAERNYPEAVLTFFYLILRFYPGNIYQAGQKAEDWNRKIQADYKSRLIAILEQIVE